MKHCFKGFIYFSKVGHFREFINIIYEQFYYFCWKYQMSDGYFHPWKEKNK